MKTTRTYLTILTLLLAGLQCCMARNTVVKPEDFAGRSMSEKIAKALESIRENGGGSILFKDTPVYLIDKAIELPSDTEMIIDDCMIKLSDHVFDNIIRSGNLIIDSDHPNEYVSSLAAARNIKITGKGNAVVEGADDFYEGVNPKSGQTEKWLGDFWGWRNFSILFSFVDGFSVSGITLRKTHSWGIVFTNGCRNGRVSDISLHTTVKNGDGISIIQGGSDILIENVSGSTSDDAIVLAAFDETRWSNPKYIFPLLPVRYSDYSYGADIHDVTIRNVHVSGKYHEVIFLPSRPQIYNIRCENISDGLEGGKNVIIRFYGNGQYGKGFKPGNVHHVTLDGITSNMARATIEKLAPVYDCTFKNLTQNNPQGVLVSIPDKELREEGPDTTLVFRLPRKGLYRIYGEVGRLDMDDIKPGVMIPTRYVTLRINGGRKTRRIISDLDHYTGHCLGIFNLKKSNTIDLWLPEMVRFDSLRMEPYHDEPVPEELRTWEPYVVPPRTHPRLWVTPGSLEMIRSCLLLGENAPYWDIVCRKAVAEYPYHVNQDIEEFFNPELEDLLVTKAFYYLMTKDQKVGKSCVRIAKDYLGVLEYGNVRRGDITRNIGNTIYTAALVYDWCNDLIGRRDKVFLHDRMMDLARIMEIGWPPFKDNIVSGHASEAQVNRDLLAMAISFHDLDRKPYRYVSYQMEKIIRMRAFEYQSPRHSQGYDYGNYRHGWEMRAAWMLRRMSGRKIFDDNISGLAKYWLYMRLPGGDRFADGDRFPSREHDRATETLLLDYAYSGDTTLKREFIREGGMKAMEQNPVLFLLLNDPSLNAAKDLSALPHSLDYGDILGGMSSRTGWDLDSSSNDVFSDIRGGGYHFGNHQHSDAGSFQIFHKGRIITNAGVYMAYGTPYDFNYYKRSIAHNTVLVKDPEEPLEERTRQNDGGSRFNQMTPLSPEDALERARFNYGKVVSVSFSPDSAAPCFSFFKADLASAYSNKIREYSRSYCFMDLEEEGVPAAVVVYDNLKTRKACPSFWKVNTLVKPEYTTEGIRLSSYGDTTGHAYIIPLLPRKDNIVTELSSIRDSSSILGKQFQIRYPRIEADAYQVVESLKEESDAPQFLNLIQITTGNEPPLPYSCSEKDGWFLITIADRLVCIRKDNDEFDGDISFPSQGNNLKVLVTGLKPGTWTLTGADGRSFDHKVKERDNSLSFSCNGSDWNLSRRTTS